MVDHLVFSAVREEVADLVSSIHGLSEEVPSTVDLSGGYTHALFARFEDAAGLQKYMEHPAHLAVVEKLDATTTGRIVVDYEF
jgi:hypothetical protein